MDYRKYFYKIKPFTPRGLQIFIRRKLVLSKRSIYSDIWPIDERAKRPPQGWKGWPGGKKFSLVLTHDVETNKGQEKCSKLVEIEKRHGFRSSFGFVPERYRVSPELRQYLENNGFEVMLHGLYHDGKYYDSRKIFQERANLINYYLRDWGTRGFRSPSMLHNLDWILDLNIEYDSSTFDTDPFEPQPAAVQTIFPFYVHNGAKDRGYVELPYTLPQDFTLFVLMREKDIRIWKRKLDWIAECSGMALIIVHPDYMNFDGKRLKMDEYPAKHYEVFLEYVKHKFEGQYWNVLPREIARFWASELNGIKNR